MITLCDNTNNRENKKINILLPVVCVYNDPDNTLLSYKIGSYLYFVICDIIKLVVWYRLLWYYKC